MTFINEMTVQDEAHVAFGGERNSGLGRFNGEWAIEEFTTDADAVSDEAGAADAGGAEKPAANPAPVNADRDPDGDVSKIMQDIEALGGGDGSEETPLDFGEQEDRAALKRQPEE